MKNNEIISYQNLDTKFLNMHYKVWLTFVDKFHWSHEEIKLFLRVMEKKYFKFKKL